MVKVQTGDLFRSDAQTLVNTVNCVGIMGKGIALEFKKRFPQMYEDYVARCSRREVKLGRPYLYKNESGPWVLNFPTKDHWRSVTNLKDIVAGLEYLLKHYKEWSIKSVAVPPLGCGQGQLEWRVVGRTLYRHLNKMDIPVELYAPHGTPVQELQPQFLQHTLFESRGDEKKSEPQWIKSSWVGLVEILSRIQKEPYHKPVGRTIFQKIAFAATMEGLPTGLQFQKGSYGPFAHELKELTTRLVNNGLIQEETYTGRMFVVKPGPTFTDAKKEFSVDLESWSGIIRKVADLFVRLDTKEAEIVTSVLFAEKELKAAGHHTPTERQVLDSVMQWKARRKPPVDKTEVGSTIRNLAALGWLSVQASEDLPVPEEMMADA